MLREEATWLGAMVTAIGPDQMSPMLNVGSASEEYRDTQQPWTGALLDAFVEAGGRIINTDITSGQGIDLVGDITNAEFRATLRSLGPRSVLCTNVLQYVPDPASVCRGLLELLPEGGFLVLSTPYRYPYHVDTGFRISAHGLAAMAPGTEIVDAEDVHCGTFADSLIRNPRYAFIWIVRVLVPLYRFDGWKTALSRIPWLRREFEVACVVLRIAPDHDQPADTLYRFGSRASTRTQ